MNKPNIVFILMDDLGWRDLGCYGSAFYETPNIDLLARDGMFFTDAYAACPVCSPTRASLMSGKYPATVGVTDWIDHGTMHPLKGTFGRPGRALIEAPYIKCLPLSEYSIARALRDGGYQTWHVGKWHLGQEATWPDKHGFDANVAGSEIGGLKNGYFSPYGIPNLTDGPEGEYMNDRLTDEAIKLIEGSDGRPFFLNFWHYAVHTKIEAPAGLVGKYRRKRTAMGLDDVQVLEDVGPFQTEWYYNKGSRIMRRLVQSDPDYAAMIENVDYNVGRLMDALREKGLEDDTIFIFTSDNGGLATVRHAPTTNLPLAEGKGWMYEGGVREPLLIKWPGHVQPGSVCHEPVTSPDYYPTFLELAGLPAKPEQHTDGVSFLPLLKGELFDRGAIYWHYPHYGGQGGTPGSSIRRGEWKLLEFYETDKVELYNLRDDIGENRNRAEEYPELAAGLLGMLRAWRDSVGAKYPAVREK